MNLSELASRTGTGILLLSAFLTAACAAGIRGEAPFAQVTGWRLGGGNELTVDLRLRNVNDEPLRIRALELAVNIDDDLELFRHSETLDIEIAAGGFETLRLDTDASDAGRSRLGELSDGTVGSLPYALEGVVEPVDGGELAIARSGHIYPVPGRPGEFR